MSQLGALEQMALTPAGMPPPGVIPNLIDPTTDRGLFITVGTIFLVVMLGFASLRFYTKFAITRAWGWDDGESKLVKTIQVVADGRKLLVQ